MEVETTTMETSNHNPHDVETGERVSDIAEMLSFAIMMTLLTALPLVLIGATDTAVSVGIGAFFGGLTVKKDKQEKRNE